MRTLALASSLVVALAAALPPVPPLGPNPLAGVVAAQRAFATDAPFADSKLKREDYLTTISGVVAWWLPHQNAAGAIIDPASLHEEEYSTPCFAHAAATLVASGRKDLLLPAAAALNWSIHSLAIADCATGHCDFFSVPVMRSVSLLTPLVPAAEAAAWEASLRTLTLKTWEITGNNWELTAAAGEYDRIVKRGWNNDPANLNWTFWESRIGRLTSVLGEEGGFWTLDGIFNDNTGANKVSPMAYDAFGSSYVAVLLSEGYNETGVYRDFLSDIMERGVWTHASYESPFGEQPVGGRSNQHQFAEATLAAVAELYAGKALAAGDALGACQLQRAAHLYHSSVRRWQRADGALQILKNNFLNYTERFGYMGYSFFSNYNLLPASWLALAFEFASPNDAIPECAAPADVGGVAFALSSNTMRKVFASVSGTYIELMTGADPDFDSSGFNRFHFSACGRAGSPVPCALHSLLGPSQAPGLSGNLAASLDAPLSANGVSTGPVWRFVGDAPGTHRSLANNTLQTIIAAIVTADATNSPTNGVSFTVDYILWGEGVLVTETYFLPPSGGQVNVSVSLSLPGTHALFTRMADAAAAADGVHVFFSPPADAALAHAVHSRDELAFLAASPPPRVAPSFESMGIRFPVMAFDGTTNFTIFAPNAHAPDTVVVQPPSVASPEEGALAFNVEPPTSRAPLVWTFDRTLEVVSRNGVLVPAVAELLTSTEAPRISYSLTVIPWVAGHGAV